MKVLAISAALLLLTPMKSAAQAHPLEPLAFLVGHCWAGTFPDGKQTDEHCFEWMFDRKFVRDRHVVHNAPKPYSGETIYQWDRESQRITFTYWNSDGGIETGAAYAENGVLTFPAKYRSAQGELDLRAVWTRDGDNAYRVEQYQRVGDAWKTMWTMTMKRKQ